MTMRGRVRVEEEPRYRIPPRMRVISGSRSMWRCFSAAMRRIHTGMERCRQLRQHGRAFLGQYREALIGASTLVIASRSEP